jgi:hypothetical protein
MSRKRYLLKNTPCYGVEFREQNLINVICLPILITADFSHWTILVSSHMLLQRGLLSLPENKEEREMY